LASCGAHARPSPARSTTTRAGGSRRRWRSGRIRSRAGRAARLGPELEDVHDGFGHRVAAGSESYTWQFSGGQEGYDTADKQAEHRSYARSYYAADGKLRVHQINRDSLDYRFYDPPQDTTIFYGDPWGAYEEYWYDALGRRVLKRSRQNSPICTDTDRCQSSVERFVWDGDQILWELRTSSGSVDTKDPTGSDYTGQSGSIGLSRPPRRHTFRPARRRS